MIKIEPYSTEWEEKHAVFASKYWTKKRRKDASYIYWKFRGKSNEKLKSFILAIDNGEVVGQLGLVPCKINVDDEIYDAQWACDLMVDTHYRGKNIAKLLYEHAHTNKSITLGSDPSPAASKSMKKSGYKSLEGPFKHLFAVHIGEVFKLKGFDNKILNSIPNPFLLFFLIINKFFNKDFKDFPLNNYNQLNHYQKLKRQIAVERDLDFVKWRFNPFLDFYPGMEIMISPNKNIFFSGYYTGNSYYITDYNAKSIFQLFQIIAFIVNRFKASGLQRVRFCCNQESISRFLLFFGIIKFRTRTEIIYFSHDSEIKKKLEKKSFYYTFMDSDENI